MAAPRRTSFQAERDREQIAVLYCQGKTQFAIAERLGISRAMVAYDLGLIQQRWRKATVLNLDDAKAKELAKVDELERTYWDAWRASLEEREKTTTEQRNTGDTAVRKASIQKESRDGNPAFLAGVQWCIERRCKLLGLDAPTRQEHTGKDGGAIQHTHDVTALMEKLQRLAEAKE